MTGQSIDSKLNCPLGANLQKYWDRLSPLERQMRLDAEALYSLVVQDAAIQTAKLSPGAHVLDPFCGAGGSAIGFARAGKVVTAVELNPERLAMAKYNAALFGVQDKINFIEGNALDLIPRVDADTIFLSPPWGGPDYTKRPLFTFECFNPNGNELMNLALRSGKDIVLQLPRNFDFNEFKHFERSVSISEDRLGGHLLSYTAVVKVD